eukprot:Sspe_Gene.97748::Locus_71285_Transcript_1_2_Confidence_0.800_Length_2106::g.97748::m.97748
MRKTGQFTLRDWDRGSRQQRIQLLTNFIAAHRHSTGADIDRDLGAVAILFFTRITAWLRLTYMLGYELSVQLSAISLFMQGHKYLTHFLEIGGVATLLDIINHSWKAKEDKQNALLILIHIANSGRVHREIICDDMEHPTERVEWAEQVLSVKASDPKVKTEEFRETVLMQLENQKAASPAKASSLQHDVLRALNLLGGTGNKNGVELIVDSLMDEDDDNTLELYGSLFVALGHGNPRKRSLLDSALLRAIRHGCDHAALCAASALRSLQATNLSFGDRSLHPFGLLSDSGDDEAMALVATLARLLESPNVKLKYEGTELLVAAACNPSLLPFVVSAMTTLLSYSPDAGFDLAKLRRQQAGAVRIIGRIVATRLEKEQPLGLVFDAVRGKDVAEQLLDLIACSDSKDLDLHRECAVTLQYITSCPAFDKERALVQDALSSSVFDDFRRKETFDVDFLRDLRDVLLSSSGRA